MNTDYGLLIRQIKALAEISRDGTALMTNASALLYEALPDVNWAGFYLVRRERDGRGGGETEALIVGPFQGKPACVRIEKGRGVCGTSWAAERTLIVPDVHKFPGHIACDSASNSEIVVPLRAACGGGERETGQEGEIFGVLDIDSPKFDRFNAEDAAGLEAFARALEEFLRG